MFDLYAHIDTTLRSTMQERFDDKELRRKTGAALMVWLRDVAKKRSVPDLQRRMDRMEADVAKMVENMKLEFAGGKVVIKVNGSDEDTLKAFRLGTSWFEPNPDLVETLLTGLFDE